MTAFLSWYAVVQVLGAAAYALISPCLRRLPDAGYAVSKTLGVLSFGLLLWLATALGLVRNDPRGAWVVTGLLIAGACLTVRSRSWPGTRIVVTSELVFAAAFGGWSLLRSVAPAVAHTEQPMDLMLLTAVSTSPAFPPADAWLAGHSIGYYYLGYWLIAAIGFVTAQAPEVSYNVGQACWFGMLVLGCFGLGFNLASSASGGGARRWLPTAAGALAALAVAGSANLHLITGWLGVAASGAHSPVAGTPWWWWQSGRVLRTSRRRACRSRSSRSFRSSATWWATTIRTCCRCPSSWRH
ncbi:MAG: DUF2298 domain-containing protein [Vicinamibacterales bacterium]